MHIISRGKGKFTNESGENGEKVLRKRNKTGKRGDTYGFACTLLGDTLLTEVIQNESWQQKTKKKRVSNLEKGEKLTQNWAMKRQMFYLLLLLYCTSRVFPQTSALLTLRWLIGALSSSMCSRACNLSTKTKKFLSTKIFVDNAFVDNCRQKFNFFKTWFFKFLIIFLLICMFIIDTLGVFFNLVTQKFQNGAKSWSKCIDNDNKARQIVAPRADCLHTKLKKTL